MKILVISDIPPFITGGAEMQALRLIDEWLAEGHDVQCLGRSLPYSEIARPSGKLITHSIPIIRSMGRYLKAASYFFSLAKFLLRYQRWPDIIYTRFLGDAAITVCLLKYLGLIKATLISTPANAGSTGDIFYINSAPFSKFWLKLINLECNAINLIAPQMLKDLQKAGILKPLITQIPNGVPIYEKRIRFTDNSDTVAILSVGRLTPQKGYDIFLEALYNLKHSFTSFIVTIIGDGPEKEHLNQLIYQYSLQNYVHLVGELDQAEIKNYHNTSDIFALPSRYEGMSNAALEAMEAGMPLLLTKCGGLDTYIDSHMGWIAETGSAESLLDSLIAALKTDKVDLIKMGATNREFVLQTFSMKNVANRYLELFNSLL